MEISQFSFILLATYSFFFGVALGVVYDIIRIQRVLLGAKCGGGKTKIDYREIELPIIKKKAYSVRLDKAFSKVLGVYIALGDVAFATTCGVAVVLVAYAYNSGRVRAIIYLGLLLGFLVYYFTIGRLVMKLSRLVSFLIRSAVVYAYEMIVYPIKLTVEMLKNRAYIKKRRTYDKREKQKLDECK